MFLVTDNLEQRHTRIREFKGQDASIGAVLAAIDFEWTLRRAILACGTSPNRVIRDEVLRYCHGLDKYKEAWKNEVKPRFGTTLPALLGDWQYLKKEAFPLRHRLVHGVRGRAGSQYAKDRRDVLLRASCTLCDFAVLHGIDLYSRLPVRRRS